jgi:hypothetical protein
MSALVVAVRLAGIVLERMLSCSRRSPGPTPRRMSTSWCCASHQELSRPLINAFDGERGRLTPQRRLFIDVVRSCALAHSQRSFASAGLPASAGNEVGLLQSLLPRIHVNGRTLEAATQHLQEDQIQQP